MTIKALSLSAAMAALMATGALAQNTADPAAPPAVTAPAATPPAAAATDPVAKPKTTGTAAEAIQFTQSAGATQMAFSTLKGTNVRNAAGENLGDIKDVIIDIAGKPGIAIIGVGGFLGIGEKNVGVTFEALQFTTSSETNTPVARLDVTKDVLTSAPAFVYADPSAPNDRPAVRTQ